MPICTGSGSSRLTCRQYRRGDSFYPRRRSSPAFVTQLLRCSNGSRLFVRYENRRRSRIFAIRARGPAAHTWIGRSSFPRDIYEVDQAEVRTPSCANMRIHRSRRSSAVEELLERGRFVVLVDGSGAAYFVADQVDQFGGRSLDPLV